MSWILNLFLLTHTPRSFYAVIVNRNIRFIFWMLATSLSVDVMKIPTWLWKLLPCPCRFRSLWAQHFSLTVGHHIILSVILVCLFTSRQTEAYTDLLLLALFCWDKHHWSFNNTSVGDVDPCAVRNPHITLISPLFTIITFRWPKALMWA